MRRVLNVVFIVDWERRKPTVFGGLEGDNTTAKSGGFK